MTRFYYNNRFFKIIDEIKVKNSSREVKFSNLTIDFTDRTIDDLPVKYQECKILRGDVEKENQLLENGEVIYFGYINDYTLPTMKKRKEFRELELELLSPMQIATYKYVTAIGTYELGDLIDLVLAPLISEGFTIKERNINENSQITVSFLLETIEFCMNTISNKKNIWWFIDKEKNITINSIDYQFSIAPVETIDENDRDKGIIDIIPSVVTYDYANVINIKNARLYSNESILNVPMTINGGEEVDFLFPIDISEEAVRKQDVNNTGALNNILILTNIGTTHYIGLRSGVFKNEGFCFSDDSDDIEKQFFTLRRDPMFKNLVTGITLNEDLWASAGCGTKATIIYFYSNTALKYTNLRFLHQGEIDNNKGKISNTGIVEKTIDANEKWFTLDEITEYARNMVKYNKNECSTLKLSYDKDKGFKVGDMLEINMPHFFAQGKFVITDEEVTHSDHDLFVYELRNANVLENFIDVFREKETQESNKKVDNVVIGNYVEEKLIESHEVINEG